MHRSENVDVRSEVLKCEEVLFMCMHMEYMYPLLLYTPSQMGAYWSYRLITISYDAHTVRSTVTERKAQKEILQDIEGEWNERSL